MSTSNTFSTFKALSAASILCLVIVSAILSACATHPGSPNLESSNQNLPSKPTSIAALDVPRYMGRWYEIGHLPMFFQRSCTKNTTATYSLQNDGSVQVTNRCISKSGSSLSASGRATKTDMPAQLKVSFAPSWVQALGLGKSNYWVLKLDDAYQYALVGTPDKKYLWLLSRTPTMPDGIFKDHMDAAKAQGYDLSKWIKTEQSR